MKKRKQNKKTKIDKKKEKKKVWIINVCVCVKEERRRGVTFENPGEGNKKQRTRRGVGGGGGGGRRAAIFVTRWDTETSGDWLVTTAGAGVMLVEAPDQKPGSITNPFNYF